MVLFFLHEVTMARLLIHESNGVRQFEIVDEEVRIGRELDNNLRISDSSVSRHHAILRQSPKGYVVQDQKSVNGITYKDRKVKEVLLVDGAEFSLGQVKLTFQDSDSQ
jgi:pSer/pThr/pTyr-binding forkhead associated (FHA) protein